ncbi:MAG TPA: Uma2 family endonuclease, partial [Bryobacteraceae bacterium]|nr:Uma2 family endonuclease [Bryobacteraceae bacterium]
PPGARQSEHYLYQRELRQNSHNANGPEGGGTGNKAFILTWSLAAPEEIACTPDASHEAASRTRNIEIHLLYGDCTDFTGRAVDKYLESSYRPDIEYVDGYLVHRSEPEYLHSLLQAILIAYFRKFEKEYKCKALPELRIQIVERARYRIPDVLLCATPTRVQKIMNETPLAVIEVLSPGDTVKETLQRFRDYAGLGVPHIIQMDPETEIAHRFQEGSLIQTTFHGLGIRDTSIPFDSEHLFAELRREIEEAAAKD